MKKKTLPEITRTLHKLLSSLPAVKAHSSAEVVKRHLQLIAYYQRQYDLLIAQTLPRTLPAS